MKSEIAVNNRFFIDMVVFIRVKSPENRSISRDYVKNEYLFRKLRKIS